MIRLASWLEEFDMTKETLLNPFIVDHGSIKLSPHRGVSPREKRPSEMHILNNVVKGTCLPEVSSLIHIQAIHSLIWIRILLTSPRKVHVLMMSCPRLERVNQKSLLRKIFIDGKRGESLFLLIFVGCFELQF